GAYAAAHRRARREGRDLGRHAAQDRLGARCGAKRRKERAHHRRPRAACAASRSAYRSGRRHAHQEQVGAHRARTEVRVARIAPSRRVWIFDLDNTLHDATAAIFPSLHVQINEYLKRRLGLDDEGANRMRRDLWMRYGTTLAGLVRHYGEDPRRFLAETHVFPELADVVQHESALRHALARLGGRKLVFSNAPRHYVGQVL